MAVQFLFNWQSAPSNNINLALDEFHSALETNRADFKFGEALVMGVVAKLTDIDAQIARHSTNWQFNRIGAVNLAIMRVATHEMLHRMDIPPFVSINEALDICKVMSDDGSRKYINGVLDGILRGLPRDGRTGLPK